MLPQALRMAGRSALPLLRCADRWADVIACAASRQVKTLEQMPGPSSGGFIWDLLFRRGLSRLHQLQLEGRRRYGAVWKASFGPILTVHVAEPELIEQVLRQEGTHPMRSDLSSWKDYRRLRGEGYGLLTAEGEEWQSVRSLLGKHMLRPKAVEAYDGPLNAVVTDLIHKLKLRSQQSSSGLVTDISAEFYCFGLEGISSVLFESRIGCLDPVVPVETERFIQSINTMFVMTLLTMAMPRWLHRLLPKPWDTFCRCWDYMFQFAKGHIDQRLEEERQKMARGERLEGRYLTYFLSQAGVPLKSVYSNVTELLLAGVDTISGTLSWSLYELSRHPEVQTALRDEVRRVMKDRSVPEARDVAAMPLMKAVIKEILRLYPVIPANARVITDRDITVGGYLIPKNTLITLCHYATSRDPRQFCDPDEFVPKRWLSRSEGSHPYASVPFGVGKRSCVGRRIAELELYLALSRILMHFNVEPAEDSGPVRPMTRTLLVPERQINLRFIER
ncbi:25-hydroxyvitamin D-1 alpha hydroxylase, mitochondrial [Carassius gibelio]|uniref:25-hydroxyvitamin D-1 alpha hydroxylase, mitochondrial n=1 Tax=Carassius gibelio TaxID=101364 RepID=UPI0022778582|nr:25-hydroxyvitamin D-1 alpha hydroxylase, mitochondrial [Carassius gibelio]